MKPPAFSYHAPDTVSETLRLLSELGGQAKILAGGQSLIPLLNMRLASPRHLVDLRRITELDTVTVDASGVGVGAMARHARVERDAATAHAVPLLPTALRLVAHSVIRNRGTVVGSLAHADPSAELTAVLALLDGTVTVADSSTQRTVSARDFFVGPLESCLRPTELAVRAHFPRLPRGSGTAIREVARRSGDYALCGAAAAVTLDSDRRIRSAWLAYLSLAPVPLVVDVTPAVAGSDAHGADWDAAVHIAHGWWEPEADIHATAAYRGHLAAVLTRRTLCEAAAAALADSGGAADSIAATDSAVTSASPVASQQPASSRPSGKGNPDA
ncbi:FAD binding domain-containing protein [Lipingzhangella sp. LS1_29]|uniref:FAD binding domain-containing protein n=1 Tax=Lipingzhangella rawalii TaxID=2055835 RepID=A0ABU2HCE9_9ACTN|nr:FAD binding domain-containing protein [Lipingzhangella rawalii]MDS1272480.1 FAD binding domain-containing protein [Lipingzhangella rawalii]